MANELKFTVKVEDNLDKLLREEPEKIAKALYAMGTLGIEGAVRSISKGENEAVDTGRLRASISFVTTEGDMDVVPAGMQKTPHPKKTPKHKGKGKNIEEVEADNVDKEKDDYLSGNAPKNSVLVGSNVEYASYVHNGTSRRTARPFITDGINKTKGRMERQVKAILKGEL